MKIINEEKIIEFEVKKSRFIGYMKPVNSVKSANEYIESIRKKHFDATHNVPLYRVIEDGKEFFKYNDDNEPSSTAGKPMADIVERKELVNIAMVATRYFGGIKLGASGLIRAYAKVAKDLLNESDLIEYVKKVEAIISFAYSEQKDVDYILFNSDIQILEKSYFDRITMKIFLKEEDLKLFENKNIDVILI